MTTGNYGDFSESVPPDIAERQVVRAAPDQAPKLTGIEIDYGSTRDANLTLSGFLVQRTSVADVIHVRHASGLRLHRLTVTAAKWAVDGDGVDGVVIWNAEDTIVDRTKIESVHRGMQIHDSHNTRILGNYIIATAGSGIQYLDGNTATEIAYNHIRGADYTPYPQDPDAVDSPHASIISFRGGDVTLRGNHLHGMGNSSGIMFYKPDAAGGQSAYSNVLVENNAIYDVINTYAFRVYNLGSNFVVRNNVIYPGRREGDCDGAIADARYRYNTAIIVHDLAPGGGGLQLYNNILVGIVSIGDDAFEDERNNYAWSWQDWKTTSPSGTSHIVTSAYEGCGGHETVFEDGSFFDARVDPSFPGRDPQEFDLKPGSAGWDFGEPSFQPVQSIGRMDETEFLSASGPCRSQDRHSVGAYQLGD